MIMMPLNYPYYTLLNFLGVAIRHCTNPGAFIAVASYMVLRIDKSNNSRFVIFALSGRIENETMGELQEILASEQANQKIAFDLMNIKLVDQHSVEFLEQCEAQGVELWNCPAYLREWIVRVRAGNEL